MQVLNNVCNFKLFLIFKIKIKNDKFDKKFVVFFNRDLYEIDKFMIFRKLLEF